MTEHPATPNQPRPQYRLTWLDHIINVFLLPPTEKFEGTPPRSPWQVVVVLLNEAWTFSTFVIWGPLALLNDLYEDVKFDVRRTPNTLNDPLWSHSPGFYRHYGFEPPYGPRPRGGDSLGAGTGDGL